MEYMPIVSNTRLDQLRRQVTEAEREVERATTWRDRNRAEANLRGLKQQLQSAERERQEASRSPAPTQHAAHVARAVAEGRFMPPVPYWITPAAKAAPAPVVEHAANAAPEIGRLSWSQLGELVPAAMAELRRAGAAK